MTLALCLSACIDFTSIRGAELNHALEQNTQRYPVKGHVFALRGIFGIFSTGMDKLADKLQRDMGINAIAVAHHRTQKLTNFIIKQHQQRRLKPPIILVGHSLGADDDIKAAYQLDKANVPVELLITLDPVNPIKVPPNVKRVVNIYMPHKLDMIPVFRGMPVAAIDTQRTKIENINLNQVSAEEYGHIHHFNIDKDDALQRVVMSIVKDALVTYDRRDQKIEQT